jgi:hypothetical protein
VGHEGWAIEGHGGPLFDDLVSTQQEGLWDREPERLGLDRLTVLTSFGFFGTFGIAVSPFSVMVERSADVG